MGFFLVIMLLHTSMLLFGGCHICPKKVIMLLHMLLFGAYAVYYALILGSNSTTASELPHAGSKLAITYCRGVVVLCGMYCWLLTARCSSRPLLSVCCVLGCVRAVFLCLLFLQIADVDVFFLCFIDAYFCDK